MSDNSQRFPKFYFHEINTYPKEKCNTHSLRLKMPIFYEACYALVFCESFLLSSSWVKGLGCGVRGTVDYDQGYALYYFSPGLWIPLSNGFVPILQWNWPRATLPQSGTEFPSARSCPERSIWWTYCISALTATWVWSEMFSFVSKFSFGETTLF